MDGATIVRDAHLHPPSHVPRASLTDRSAVNQSLGILIDRGMDAATARDELDALARRDDVDLATAARSLLDSTVPPESTQSS